MEMMANEGLKEEIDSRQQTWTFTLIFLEYSKVQAYVVVQQVLKTEGNCQGRTILHVEKAVEIISKMQKIFAVRIYQNSIFNGMNHFP